MPNFPLLLSSPSSTLTSFLIKALPYGLGLGCNIGCVIFIPSSMLVILKVNSLNNKALRIFKSSHDIDSLHNPIKKLWGLIHLLLFVCANQWTSPSTKLDLVILVGEGLTTLGASIKPDLEN